MENGVEEQIVFLLSIILSGMGCGLVYDIIRARRKLLNLGNIYVNIEDVIFCIFTGVVFLAVTFYLNSGIVRTSGFFGIIFGELLYFLLIRNRIRNLIIVITKKIIKILILAVKIIVFPIRLVKRLLKKPIYIVAWYVSGHVKKVKSKLKLIGSRAGNHIKLFGIFVGKRSKKH